MKRALAIFAALSLFGFAGMAQMFTGTWEGCIDILPDVGFGSTTLTITYDMAGWAITSITGFTSSGYTQQDFEVEGALGALSISGKMGFDPQAIEYEYSDLSAAMDFAGISFDLGIFHGIYPYGESYFNKYYYPYTFAGVYNDLCDDTVQTDDVLMFYTLEVSADPVSATIHLGDCCTGIQLYDLSVSLSGLSLCCGVTYDFSFAFSKHDGFEYAMFSLNDVFPICCGISFDIAVKFTTEGKTISLTPKFAGFGEACFELYADIESEGGNNADLYLNAIRIDGWKIYCELADCNWLEIVSFLSPDKATDYGIYDFVDDEFEYIKLGFCGPTCCGGQYNVSLAVYFTDDTALFGISRIGAEVTWPLAENFNITLTFDSDDNLSLCWEFSF
ncbi:hypothetical protein DRJ54_03625 [Candidatus Acetothermia bacterium]|nr:MAG: hypothetical protein DRJ54_03625 [Candidatus Acetothermia bacterium]